MIQFLISAAFVLVFLFLFALLASAMLWVIVRVLRSLFPPALQARQGARKGRGVKARPAYALRCFYRR